MLASLLLVLLAGIIFAKNSSFFSPINKFGIGIYNDTQGSPPYNLQLPVAANLTGLGGWVLLFFQDISPATSTPQASPWALSALNQAYSLGVRPLVRLGQWPRNYRDWSDDPLHTKYTKLAQTFRYYVQQLPLPLDGSKLTIQLLNEPNICGEWQCTDGPSRVLLANETAIEVASLLRDFRTALATLPRLDIINAPLAQVSDVACPCDGTPANSSARIPALTFLSDLISTVPTLYDDVSFLASHVYPFCDTGYWTPCARADLQYYTFERNLVLQMRGIALPVLLAETGWASSNETMKALSMVQFYKDLLADDSVVGVMPFLMAGGPVYTIDGWSWTLWNDNATSVTVYEQQYSDVRSMRCSLGLPPAC